MQLRNSAEELKYPPNCHLTFKNDTGIFHLLMPSLFRTTGPQMGWTEPLFSSTRGAVPWGAIERVQIVSATAWRWLCTVLSAGAFQGILISGKEMRIEIEKLSCFPACFTSRSPLPSMLHFTAAHKHPAHPCQPCEEATR